MNHRCILITAALAAACQPTARPARSTPPPALGTGGSPATGGSPTSTGGQSGTVGADGPLPADGPSPADASILEAGPVDIADPAGAVLTSRYDNARTGWDQVERTLTVANVKPDGFGLLFSRAY